MQVAIDIQGLLRQKTGVGHALYDLIEALAALDEHAARDEFTAFYFSRRRLELPFCHERFCERQITFPPGRALSWLWKRVAFPKLDRFLDTPDVVHFPDFVARPVKRSKVVVTVHDLSFLRLPETVEPKNREFLARNVPRSLDRADAVIAVSDFTRREIEDAFPQARGKIHVVYHGVRPALRDGVRPALHPHDQSAPVNDTDLAGLPRRFILTVGTIEPRKNLDMLLDALRLLRSDSAYSDVGLVVAGARGWLAGQIEQRLDAEQVQGRVVRLKYVSDDTLCRLYNTASVLAFPTLYEGFGLPALEAMACGLPVVCTNAASLPEVVGDAAILVKQPTPEAFAESLGRVLADEALAADLRQRGLARAATFTWETAARQTLDVYRHAAEGSDANRH